MCHFVKFTLSAFVSNSRSSGDGFFLRMENTAGRAKQSLGKLSVEKMCLCGSDNMKNGQRLIGRARKFVVYDCSVRSDCIAESIFVSDLINVSRFFVSYDRICII